MTRVLRVAKWDTFQHYKDRNPIWIKLYVELLDRKTWLDLSDIARAQLVGCWMLAAKRGNALPASPSALRVLIGSNAPMRLRELLDGGWLEYAECSDSGGDRDTLSPTVQNSSGDSIASRASAPSREEEGEEERETSLLLLPAREGATSPPIALTVAANQAITRKWGESPNPLLAQHAKTHELAAFVAAEAIPVPFAQRSIARQVLAKNDGPPRTMAYFRAGILDDWRGHQAAQEAAASPLITPLELAAVRRGASVADTSRDSAYRAAVELQRIAQDRSA